MDRLRDTSFGTPPQQDEAPPLRLEDLESYPRPAEILGQIGLVIAVCLGLGLLARIMVAFVGIY